MKTKRKINILKPFAMIMSTILLFTPITGYASVIPSNTDNNDKILIEKIFQTTNQNDKAETIFNDTYEQDGMLYELTAIETEIINTENVAGDVYLYTPVGVPNESELIEPDKTIIHNGSTYTLKNKKIKTTENEPFTKYVERTILYTNIEDNDQIPGVAEIESANNSGETILKYMPLIKWTIEKENWDSTFEFPIKITEYDADSFMLNGVEIKKSEPLINYKFDFLEYLGLSKDYYRINIIEWDGEEYYENGKVCRKAIAKGDKIIKDITALYGGEMSFGASSSYSYECTYVSEAKPDTTVYTLKAIATYIQTNNIDTGNEPGLITPEPPSKNILSKIIDWAIDNPIAALGIGTLIVIATAILMLFLFTKKKEKEEKNKVEIVDIEKKDE